MKRILALWLAAMLIAVQPCYAVVMVGFGQSAPAGITDNFSADTSANYTPATGSIAIGSGVATGGTSYAANIIIHKTSTGASSHYAQADAEFATTSGSGVVVGASAASGSATGYFVAFAGTTWLKLFSFSGSSVTDTGQYWDGLSLSDSVLYKIKVIKTGTSFALYVDSGGGLTHIGSDKTDSTYTGGTYAGIAFNQGPGYNPRIDNFEAGQ